LAHDPGGPGRPVQFRGTRSGCAELGGPARMPLFPRTDPVAAMKAGIHPDYHPVVFHDVTSDFKILTQSTLSSKETTKWEDGNEYPLVKVDISSSSHPFYTGKHKILDTGGRVDKFRKRYAQK
jgi:large subunit ribosomal protein L31